MGLTCDAGSGAFSRQGTRVPRRRRAVSAAGAAHRGCEAYLAAFHAAEALLFERTGKAAKTHRGLRAEFARIAKDEPRIDQPMSEFLGRAYELKSLAEYGTGNESNISLVTAKAAVETATRFVDCIANLIGED